MGSFGSADDLAEFVDTACSTVRPFESGLADVRHQSLVPEDGVLCAIRGELQTSYQATIIHEGCLAKRAGHRAEVGNGIVWRGICFRLPFLRENSNRDRQPSEQTHSRN